MEKTTHISSQLRRVVITGPESTGKSWLSQKLAEHFNTVWVPEYAREYIDKLDRPYRQDDILEISKRHLQQEEKLAKQARRFLFVDTSMLVTKIWSDFVFGQCDPWIEQKVKDHHYDLYLLCYIDTPWEYDPQREHPNARQKLYDLYLNELTHRNLPFEVVTGWANKRLLNAINFINKHFAI